MGKKTDVANLKPGMYVEELDRPWLETPFLLQGFELQTEDDIEEVRRYCRYVYIRTGPANDADSSSSSRLASMAPGKSSKEPMSQRKKELEGFVDELEKSKKTRDKSKALIDDMHSDIRSGKPVDTENAKVLVGEMVSSVTHDPDALVWLTHLKNRDEYTALHSLNVCTLSLVFGNHLGLDDSMLQELGLGALLHDIGKLRVPLEVLNKPAKLTDEEFDLMKQHPTYGVQLLAQNQGLSKDVIEVVHSHHERLHGQGYPRGLKGSQISLLSRIVSIVDVYDALTSDRVYRNGTPPNTSMKIMHKEAGTEFSLGLLEQFIECLGLFPSGSLVELNTGEVGVVIPSGKKQHRETPAIMLILDKDKHKYYPLRILDLKMFKSSTKRPEIVNVLPYGSYGINAIDYASEIVSAAT